LTPVFDRYLLNGHSGQNWFLLHWQLWSTTCPFWLHYILTVLLYYDSTLSVTVITRFDSTRMYINCPLGGSSYPRMQIVSLV
jgi:hypothetical protein